MTLDQIIHTLHLKVLTDPQDFTQVEPHGVYASDMLSCVMTGAPHGGLWITLQAHVNIVAVAALLDLAAVIITEDAQPDDSTVQKANEKGVTILATTAQTYTVCGHLWELGLR